MIGFIAFAVSIVGIMMSFFENLKMASFIVAIIAIIIAVISAYYKDKKESVEGAKKDSRALEIGAMVLSAATCLTFYVYLIIA